MYKINPIFLLFLVINLSLNNASPTQKSNKPDQTSSSTTNQNTNSFRPSVTTNHGEQNNRESEEGKGQDNEGFTKGRVFEYSYSTFHQDPQSQESMSPMNADNQETILTNGSDNFADHELARQTLPRFFSYPSNSELSENSTDPSSTIKQFQEAFKAQATESQASENPTLANFQPSLGETTAASYFSYSPPSPSFMRMGFSESEIEDDIEDDSLDNGDLDFKSSNPAKLERSSDYAKDSEDPKVKMVQVLMGRKNEKGKPWGTKTTLVYQDPKDANNYMQVTEVKMSVKSKKDGPQSEGDEVSKISKSSFRGSRHASQPSHGFSSDFLEPNDPQEPSF